MVAFEAAKLEFVNGFVRSFIPWTGGGVGRAWGGVYLTKETLSLLSNFTRKTRDQKLI